MVYVDTISVSTCLLWTSLRKPLLADNSDLWLDFYAMYTLDFLLCELHELDEVLPRSWPIRHQKIGMFIWKISTSEVMSLESDRLYERACWLLSARIFEKGTTRKPLWLDTLSPEEGFFVWVIFFSEFWEIKTDWENKPFWMVLALRPSIVEVELFSCFWEHFSCFDVQYINWCHIGAYFETKTSCIAKYCASNRSW